MAKSIYSVSQVNAYIKNMFAQDFALNTIWIRGEVSNCKYHPSGHIYFTLKDSGGVIAGVMFAGNRSGLSFRMQEGQKVIARGGVSVYERDGRYQLYAKEILLDGTGQLYQRYEQLKQELEEMGMFDSIYKKPIPKYVSKVGIVTASTGAAIQDMMNISYRRNPYVQLYLYPAIVQGEEAAPSIVAGIEYLDRFGVDVIIVGRGGGSIEDLWAFNEEPVARAIFECRTPVISAVGHETDTTIADYVADLRAPTPSAAAELAVYRVADLQEELMEYQGFLERKVRQEVKNKRLQAERLKAGLFLYSPENTLKNRRQQAGEQADRLDALMEDKLRDRKQELSLLSERLSGLSPLKKLGKGYAFVETEQHVPVKGKYQIKQGDVVQISFQDGEVKARIL